MRENCQKTNTKFYCEDVLQMLFADSRGWFVLEVGSLLFVTYTIIQGIISSEMILTLKGNICVLEMTIGRLMIALLPVHLCSAMVPQRMARVFTKHKQVIISALCPMGMGWLGS